VAKEVRKEQGVECEGNGRKGKGRKGGEGEKEGREGRKGRGQQVLHPLPLIPGDATDLD
jgi:hypothetical protein